MIDEPIMISALQHYSYCPRQCALIHIEQIFEENRHTLRGQAVHQRVDEPEYESRAGVRIERALPLFFEKIGLIGKADVVEFYSDGSILPVEYKHGPKRRKLHDDLQLAAQAMCLEDMFNVKILKGAIYHASSRRRREVLITEDLREKILEIINEIRNIFVTGKLPAPVNDDRCRECSLADACQPGLLAQKFKIKNIRKHLYEPDAEGFF